MLLFVFLFASACSASSLASCRYAVLWALISGMVLSASMSGAGAAPLLLGVGVTCSGASAMSIPASRASFFSASKKPMPSLACTKLNMSPPFPQLPAWHLKTPLSRS